MTRTCARMLTVVAAVLVALTVVVQPAVAADDDATGGIGLSADVIASGSAASATGSATSRGAGSAAAAATADAVATAASTEPAADDVLIAGGLYLSDISGSSRPTLNPFDGSAELWVTLRNLSTETIDATADFSIATFAGARIDGAQVAISELKPGESRVVGTTLHGSGQWPFVIGRVTIDPPATIDGQQTASVSRATVVYVFPWLLLIALVLGVLAFVLMRLSAGLRRTPADTAATSLA